MSCELCMSKLPLCFRISGKIFHVLGFSQINKPYIVLEDFRSELRESRGAYIISIENGDYVILGRGQSCEIKLNDISISRKHSKIKLVDNQFYIEDLESKFGTLVSLNNNTKLNKNQNLSLQINRTLLHLFVKQPINCLDLFTMCKSIRVEPIEDLSRLTYEENLEDSNAEILKRNNRSIYIININDRYDSMVGSNIIPSLTTPLSDI